MVLKVLTALLLELRQLVAGVELLSIPITHLGVRKQAGQALSTVMGGLVVV
jgi:hypothetical protein